MSLRLQRVRELLKRELGEIIRRELPVSEAGLINVNEVVVSSDLHSATVLIGALGNAAQREHASKLLQKNRKRIQGLVAKSVVLKYTPQLKFIVNDSIERGNRVLEILGEIEKTLPADPPESPDEKSSEE